MDCPDSFWIVRTVFGLSGLFFKLFIQFFDFLDNFCIIRTVFGLSEQFPACGILINLVNWVILVNLVNLVILANLMILVNLVNPSEYGNQKIYGLCRVS